MTEAIIDVPAPHLGLERSLSIELDAPVLPSRPHAPLVLDGSAPVDLLLAEVDRRRLVEGWDRRVVPLHGKVEALAPLDGLAGFTRLFDDLDARERIRRVRVEAGALALQAVDGGFDPDAAYRAEQVLCVEAAPSTWQTITALERWTGAVCRDYWFYTPAGQPGLPVHCDHQDNLVVQLEGTRRWTLYPRIDVAVHGMSRRPLVADRLDHERAVVVDLEPGDALLVPMGVPHQTQSLGPPSLHVDLALVRPRVTNLALHALAQGLGRAIADPAASAPAIIGPDSGPAVDRVLPHAKQWLETLADPGALHFWWAAALEADLERDLPRPPRNTERWALGLFHSARAYRRWLRLRDEGPYLHVHLRGRVLRLPRELRAPLEALTSQRRATGEQLSRLGPALPSLIGLDLFTLR